MFPVVAARPPAKSEVITAREGRDVLIVLASEQVTTTWSRYAPGERGPDLHVHREHTDSFYVLEGALTFGLGPGADEVVVGAGGFVSVPPGVAHTFGNEGEADACFLNLHTPDAGFAEFMRALRDGREGGFDSFAPPPGGGLPAAQAVVRHAA